MIRSLLLVDRIESNPLKCHLPNRVAEYDGEAQKSPWQIWCEKIQNPKEIHANEWIPSRPNVH